MSWWLKNTKAMVGLVCVVCLVFVTLFVGSYFGGDKKPEKNARAQDLPFYAYQATTTRSVAPAAKLAKLAQLEIESTLVSAGVPLDSPYVNGPGYESAEGEFLQASSFGSQFQVPQDWQVAFATAISAIEVYGTMSERDDDDAVSLMTVDVYRAWGASFGQPYRPGELNVIATWLRAPFVEEGRQAILGGMSTFTVDGVSDKPITFSATVSKFSESWRLSGIQFFYGRTFAPLGTQPLD